MQGYITSPGGALDQGEGTPGPLSNLKGIKRQHSGKIVQMFKMEMKI